MATLFLGAQVVRALIESRGFYILHLQWMQLTGGPSSTDWLVVDYAPPLQEYLTHSRCDYYESNLQGSRPSRFHQIDNMRDPEVGVDVDLGQ